MTVPSTPQKRLLAAGAVLSDQSWGTAETLVAASGILIEGDGGISRKQPYMPAKEADTPFVLEGDLGNIEPVDFSIPFTLRHDPGALGVLIAQLFGTAGLPVNQGPATELHTFQWAEKNTGQFSTIAIERVSKLLEIASVKPHMLDLSIADGFIKGAIGLRGDNVVIVGATNTDSEMGALTYKDRGNRMKFSGMIVDMNDQSEGDAKDETDLEVSDLAIHYERPMDSPHKAGSNSIIEPMENGPSIITVKLTFPRMNSVNNEYFADFIAETEKKIRIIITGDLIEAAHYRYLRMFFPRMRIIELDYPFDDIVPATITLQAEEATAAPTGMGYKVPYWVMMNTTSTDYLG